MKRRQGVFAMVLAVVAAATSVLGAEPSAVASAAQSPLARLEGDWDGRLDAGALKLRIILHVHTQGGATVTTLDSPDQNANGLPARLTLTGDHVSFTAQGATGVFEGDLSADGAALGGQWSGAPLAFVRRAAGAAAPVLNRPQTP